MENELASIHITYWRNQLESRLLARCEQVSREAISTKGLIPLATRSTGSICLLKCAIVFFSRSLHRLMRGVPMTTSLSKLPHGPRSGLGLLMASLRDPIGLKYRLVAKYGDLLTFPSPFGTIIQTTDPQDIQAIFAADTGSFDVFAKQLIAPFMGASSILVLTGPKHTKTRKLLMPPFHGARMRAYGETIREITERQAAGWEVGKSFSAEKKMGEISLEVIIRTVFGLTDIAQIAHFGRLTRDYVEAFSPLIAAFSFLRHNFLGIGPWAKLQRCRHRVNDVLDGEIARCKRSPEGRQDILSLLVAARYDDGSPMSDDEIKDQLLTLLFAGHETTAIALSWALYRLYQREDVRKRVLQELETLGPSPAPEAIAKLPYLEAVCHETLRLHPVTLGITRLLTQPFTLREYTLPAGASVAIDIYMLHRNPTLYPEPESFQPERFLKRTYTPFEFMPFGGGHRRCIGAAFALYEMKLVLATLLPLASLRLVHNRELKSVPRSFVVGPEQGVPMVLQSPLLSTQHRTV